MIDEQKNLAILQIHKFSQLFMLEIKKHPPLFYGDSK